MFELVSFHEIALEIDCSFNKNHSYDDFKRMNTYQLIVLSGLIKWHQRHEKRKLDWHKMFVDNFTRMLG